jgi:hypothetical protein
MTSGHDGTTTRSNTRSIAANAHGSRFQLEVDDMITADPTIFWMFLIGFGVVALRISQRTHRIR